MTFSSRQFLRPTAVDVNDVVTASQSALLRLINDGIRLTTGLDPDTAAIEADPDQIEQVVAQLVANASDAMPGGGALSIATENVELTRAELAEQPEIGPGRFVRLTVADSGEGMTDEVKAHIFEPFFSTKEQRHGTGLGLATVYAIVRQCGGFIDVESAPGRGARFQIHFPARVGDAPEPALTDGCLAAAS